MKRPIFLDGCNVSKKFGDRDDAFNCRSLAIVASYFIEAGHRVAIIFPESRLSQASNEFNNKDKGKLFADVHILMKLKEMRLIVPAPSNEKNFIDDDNFLIQLAIGAGGVIVSNDQFRNKKNDPNWKTLVESRVLHGIFYNDLYIPAQFPLGDGPGKPNLKQFLNLTDPKNPDFDLVKRNLLSPQDQKNLSKLLDEILGKSAQQSKKSGLSAASTSSVSGIKSTTAKVAIQSVPTSGIVPLGPVQLEELRKMADKRDSIQGRKGPPKIVGPTRRSKSARRKTRNKSSQQDENASAKGQEEEEDDDCISVCSEATEGNLIDFDDDQDLIDNALLGLAYDPFASGHLPSFAPSQPSSATAFNQSIASNAFTPDLPGQLHADPGSDLTSGSQLVSQPVRNDPIQNFFRNLFSK